MHTYIAFQVAFYFISKGYEYKTTAELSLLDGGGSSFSSISMNDNLEVSTTLPAYIHTYIHTKIFIHISHVIHTYVILDKYVNLSIHAYVYSYIFAIIHTSNQ